VNTSLVQTDVMVFDKQGKFIDNLKREQFVLKIDGKTRDISFFELVKAGSANEEAQLAAARGVASKSGTPAPLDRGRSMFFFLDDLHLSEESMHQTRKMLSEFVERDMGQNDQVALITATAQTGFLQQLTDNKTVLKTAIERLRARPYKNRDIQNPPMSEYQALRIDIGDRDVLDVFVEQVMRQIPNISRTQAEQEVRDRATLILRLAGAGSTRTMASLQWMMDKFRPTPGRKVVFFLSDGFLFDTRNTDVSGRLNNVIAGAAKAGFVFYSIDARGLVTGQADAGTQVMPDPSGRLSRGTMGETNAARDVMNALANDTGGKAFFNNNNLSASVTRGLDDASIYYLLAWRPEANEERNPKQRRLELSVVGRPELIVRARSSVGETPETAAKKPPSAPPPTQTTRVAEVTNALQAVVPTSGYPVDLTLNFINTAQRGDLLVSSVRLPTAALRFEKKADASAGVLLLAGMILNDEGKVLDSFNKRLTVQGKSAEEEVLPDITFTHYSPLKPGLYQVRVVAADEYGGPSGSVWDWIEITDISTKKFAMSSLLVGERKPAPTTNASNSPNGEPDPVLSQVQLSPSRRFPSSSYLRFMTMIYNAAIGPAAKPDLAVQVQVFRDNEPVVTDPLHQINTEGATDLARLSYAAELNLTGMAAGKYILQLTVIDRVAKASASQRIRFQVD
jgi:VWFA-related protein